MLMKSPSRIDKSEPTNILGTPPSQTMEQRHVWTGPTTYFFRYACTIHLTEATVVSIQRCWANLGRYVKSKIEVNRRTPNNSLLSFRPSLVRIESRSKRNLESMWSEESETSVLDNAPPSPSDYGSSTTWWCGYSNPTRFGRDVTLSAVLCAAVLLTYRDDKVNYDPSYCFFSHSESEFQEFREFQML